MKTSYDQSEASAAHYFTTLKLYRGANSDQINKAYRNVMQDLKEDIKNDSSILIKLNLAKDHLLDDTDREAYISALERYNLPDGKQGGGLDEYKAPPENS